MLELQGRKESLHALAFSADNRFLAVGGTACRIDVWDLARPDAKRPLFPKLKRTVGDVWIGPEGSEIVAAELYQGIYSRFRTGDPKAHELFAPTLGDSAAAPRITPKGDGIVGGYRPRRWEVRRGLKPVWEAPAMSGHDRQVTAYAIAPDDQRLAAGEVLEWPNAASRIAVYNMAATDPPREFGRVLTVVKRLAWSPDGGLLAAAVDTRVFVWTAAGAAAREFQIAGRKHVIDLAFHPSGRWLAVADNSGTVRLLDPGTWTAARTFEWGLPKARCVRFSPDGTLAAAGSDTGKVVVWDVDV